MQPKTWDKVVEIIQRAERAEAEAERYRKEAEYYAAELKLVNRKIDHGCAGFPCGLCDQEN